VTHGLLGHAPGVGELEADLLARLGTDFRDILFHRVIRGDRDGGESISKLCSARSLDPATLMRVLSIIGETVTDEEVPELMALPELCERWERRHHGRLKEDLHAIRAQLAVQREAAGPGDAEFIARIERFHRAVSRHLRWEGQLWLSVRRASRSSGLTRSTMSGAASRAHAEHTWVEDTLTGLLEELAAHYSGSDTPPGWPRLRRALERLQLHLHAQTFREQRWIFPRLVAAMPI
jgi:Hemerythrin HHE cation binding domain